MCRLLPRGQEGRGVDDGATLTVIEHGAQRGPGQKPRPFQVDGDQLIEARLFHLDDRAAIALNPGIVEDAVASEAVQGIGNDPVHMPDEDTSAATMMASPLAWEIASTLDRKGGGGAPPTRPWRLPGQKCAPPPHRCRFPLPSRWRPCLPGVDSYCHSWAYCLLT